MKYKILIADDNIANIELVRFILAPDESGYIFYSANDGISACKIAQQQIPDLILLDWHMPNMTGIQAIKAIKANPETRNIPILLITGDPSEENIAKAFKAGARDYITKPFNELELISRVRAAIKDSFYKKSLLPHLEEINLLQKQISLLISKNNKDIVEKFDHLTKKIKEFAVLINKY